jgi:kynurenine formamidase
MKQTFRLVSVGMTVFLATLALGACGNDKTGTVEAIGGPKSIEYRTVVDLQHTIDPKIPLWPGDPTPEFKVLANINKDGYYLRSFSIGEHSATHMNSGNSFFAGGSSIDSYEAKSLVRPAVVIDMRAQAAKNADYALTVADVEKWEKEHGKVPVGAVVLVYTGWQQKWSNPTAFFNKKGESLHFPGIAGDTAKWMLAKRKIAGVGIDTHGADPGLDTNYGTNVAILKAKGIVLECVDNLDKLKPTGNTLVIAPLKLRDGSGSPLSIMAFVN